VKFGWHRGHTGKHTRSSTSDTTCWTGMAQVCRQCTRLDTYC